MKYQQWNLRAAPAVAAVRSLELAGIPRLCAAVLCARGADTPERAAAFLAHGLELMHDPFLLRDMDRAAARVRAALEGGETVAVYGDYDVDGITATALLTEFLTGLGGRVVSYIPERIAEGYGLNRDAIRRLREEGVTLIVTVDCGITATGEVEFARSLGVDVVVTDHHHCRAELPQAAAVVDARRGDCPYPFKELAGVGVALKLALALTPEEARGEVLEQYGDLVAVGTIADVMPLMGENRAIVTFGLERLSHTRRPGLRALLHEAFPNQSAPTAIDVSYGLAPRINAAGRLEQAEVALELLLTEDPERGAELAHTLCELNRERQSIETNIFDTCTALLDREPALARPAVILAGEEWHQGVVGIVASRLAERCSCPAFMISLENGRGKGSCRSYGGFHLFAALNRLSHLLEEYGGHEQAAGFTVPEENLPAFTAGMKALVAEYAQGHAMVSCLDVDLDLPDSSLLTLDQVEALDLLEPNGAGNPRPMLRLCGCTVDSSTHVGGGRHLKLKLRRGGDCFDAIFFSPGERCGDLSPGDRVDLAFTPRINEYRGRREVQLRLYDLRPAPTRAQTERELLRRFAGGAALTAWEAAQLLPEREEFALLWRFLRRRCAGGPVEAPPEELALDAVRAGVRCSYPRAVVCIHVFTERGLVRVERGEGKARVTLVTPAQKVDLEQSEVMLRLRGLLEG